MRKIFLLICLLSSLRGMAQVTIHMEQENGIYKIPCKVNGAKMKMIFDTGESSVVISSSIAQYLYENDYITKDDILGTDSRIINNAIINLRDVEIDDIHVQNVEAIVSDSLASSILFGQSAIQKLGKISLNGNILIIENYSDETSEKQITELEYKINKAYDEKNFYFAAKYLTELERIKGLTVKGYKMLCYSYYNLNETDKCNDAIKRFENNCPNELESPEAAFMYMSLAFLLGNNNQFNEALSLNRKSMAIYIRLKDWRNGGMAFMFLGSFHNKIKECLNAIEAFKNAIFYYTKYLGISDDELKIDENLGLMYYGMAEAYTQYYSYDCNPITISYLRKAAKCGHEYSILWLKESGYSIYE